MCGLDASGSCREQWLAVVYTVMNFGLTSRVTISFSGRTLLQGVPLKQKLRILHMNSETQNHDCKAVVYSSYDYKFHFLRERTYSNNAAQAECKNTAVRYMVSLSLF
jgi:hypothetical protein